MNRAFVGMSACALALVASSASGVLITYDFPIDGLQEVPPVATPAFGTGHVTLDTVTYELTWDIAWQGLIGTVSNAHFHGAALPGVSAGVRLGLDWTQNPMIGSAFISPAFAQEVQDGLWYVNIHSSFRPGGEIRGQVVPGPGALALAGIGGLWGARRRRA